MPSVVDAEEFEEENSDPRSEGNILHSVMERVYTAEDIHASVSRIRRQGLVSPEKRKR